MDLLVLKKMDDDLSNIHHDALVVEEFLSLLCGKLWEISEEAGSKYPIPHTTASEIKKMVTKMVERIDETSRRLSQFIIHVREEAKPSSVPAK